MDDQKVDKVDSATTTAADHDQHVQSTPNSKRSNIESDDGSSDENGDNDANDDNDNDNDNDNDDGDDTKDPKDDQTDNASLKMFKKKFMLKFNFTKMKAAFFMTHLFETGFLSNHSSLLIDTLAFFVSQLAKENHTLKEMITVAARSVVIQRGKHVNESDLQLDFDEILAEDFEEF